MAARKRPDTKSIAATAIRINRIRKDTCRHSTLSCQEAPCAPTFEATHSTNSSYDRAAGTPYDEHRGVALELGARGRPSSDENGHELHFLEDRDPWVPTRPGSGWRSARAV